MKKEVWRACPICKIESFVVIPSKTYIKTGYWKSSMMEDYKESMAELPCSYFNNGKGECPFRNSCFYSHILEDGTYYEYDVQVKYYDEDG